MSSIYSACYAQSVGDTRNVTPITKRVDYTFTETTSYGPGSHAWSFDEHLNNYCSGATTNNSGWTSPFSTIYDTEWEHFTASGDGIVPSGYVGTLTSVKEYTVYGTSPGDRATQATELLGGEVYMVSWNGVAFTLGWYPFSWTRNERTWTARSATFVVTTLSGGEDGG